MVSYMTNRGGVGGLHKMLIFAIIGVAKLLVNKGKYDNKRRRAACAAP